MDKHERALLISARQNDRSEVSYGWWSDYVWEEAFESLVKRGSLKYSRWHGCPPYEVTEYKITEKGLTELQETSDDPDE